MSKEKIIDYYDTCETDYRLFWDLNHSYAMHAGYWDETTASLREALRRENQILATMARVRPTDRVLDAGCGVGGSSLFLAGEIGCETVGITLSDKQVKTARRLAEQHGLGNKCTFAAMDFCATTFADASFDVVWAIESICHAADKHKVVAEAYRLLKPGGRLVVADGFQLKAAVTPRDEALMASWLRGWGCDRLESAEAFGSHLQECEFGDIAFKDITPHVLPSSRRLYYISLPAYLLSKAGEWVGLRNALQTQNIAAAYSQYLTLKGRVWHYGIFTAVKTGG